MKTKIYNLLSLLLIVSGMSLITSCDESLKIDKIVQGNPSILSFEPASGKAGVEVTITGENLRDVKTATLGGVEAQIRYVISQQSAVIVVPQGAKSGTIILKTGDDKIPPAQSEQSFTVVYPVPTYTNIPASGKVDGEIEIQGTNLDMVSKVLFKDTEGSITYQSGKELVVKVPFVADDHVDVKLFYTSEAGEQSIGTTGDAFEIIKPRPTINETFPTSLTEGQSVTLTGENLNLIEKILFGDVEASISRTESSITFRVPTLPATATVAVTAFYYEGTATLNLSNACHVFIPKVLYYPNQMFGAHRNANFGNMFNASTGVVSTTCILKETDKQATIDFAGVINSGIHFAINGPHNTTGGLRNYWCDKKAIAKGNTMDALISEGFGDFMTTRTLFQVLVASDSNQAEIINMVNNGQILELSPEATPTLFNGTIVPASNSCRSRNANEDITGKESLIFEVGSVVLFRNEKKAKVGLLRIREINVDQSLSKADNDSGASIVFDVYYQR